MTVANRDADAENAPEAIAELVRSRVRTDVSPTSDVEGRARLVGAVTSRYGGRRRATIRAAMAFGALAALTAVGALVFAPRAALTYESADLARAGGADGALVARDDGQPGVVTFSDGSTLTLATRGRARVTHTSWRGAELAIDDGRADVHIVHRRLTRWFVAAGPYHVRVTGTRFSVAWSVAQQRLELNMRSGSVQVEGPGVQGSLWLRQGQSLVAHAGKVTVANDDVPTQPPPELSPSPASASSPASPPSAPPSAPLGRAGQPPPSDEAPIAAPARSPARAVARKPRAAGASWADRVAAGDFDAVLAAAEAAPVDAVLRNATLADLSALADAARYTGRDVLAERALTAQRKRFPSTPPASMAAFLLGRLAEDHGRADEATRWYERYLLEAPRGAFAAEALGRQMLASKRDGARARELAREYLQRFPQGAYAAVAKTVLAGR